MNIYEQIAWEILAYCENEDNSVNRLAFMREKIMGALTAVESNKRGAFLKEMLNSLIRVGTNQFSGSSEILKRTIDEFTFLLPP